MVNRPSIRAASLFCYDASLYDFSVVGAVECRVRVLDFHPSSVALCRVTIFLDVQITPNDTFHRFLLTSCSAKYAFELR